MARKSRKNIEVSVDVKSDLQKTAAYIRLSEEDGKGRSSSIDTQKQIIDNFIALSPDLEVFEYYIDNGTTGRHFEREAFQRMLVDIEQGNIDCVICKDLSRMGRNSIDTGYYIEKYFPLHNVRFIAVTDDFDSNKDDGANGLMISLKNMINEAYSMDIGKKIKAQQEQAIKDGQFVGARPPYGYKKDPNDCHKLIVNPDTAPIVKRIFQMASEGVGITAICLKLNEEGVFTPAKYAHLAGYTSSQVYGEAWQTRTINVILKAETYLGHLVQGRSSSFNRKQTQKDRSEWIRVENTHEAIISQELFDKVQAIREKAFMKSPISCTENIFKGIIFCGHCGKNLHRQKVIQKKAGEIYVFHCISRNRISKDYCNSHIHFKEDDLKSTLLSIIEKHSTAIFGMSLAMKKQNRVIENRLQSQNAELSELAKEIERHKKYLKSLYENLASGIIDVTEYKVLKQGYEEKIETARTRYFELEMQVKALSEQIANLQSLDKNLKSVNKNAALTRDVIEHLIEKIVVYDKNNIEISFKFANSFPLLKEVLENE